MPLIEKMDSLLDVQDSLDCCRHVLSVCQDVINHNWGMEFEEGQEKPAFGVHLIIDHVIDALQAMDRFLDQYRKGETS